MRVVALVWLYFCHLVLAHVDQLEMIQTFREPKKIAFGALMGGASHINWVLSILDELTTRNHTAYFVTKASKFVSACLLQLLMHLCLGRSDKVW